MDQHTELKLRISALINGNSPEVAADLIAKMFIPYRKEIEDLSAARREVGETLLRNGYPWRTGSEAEYVGRAIDDLKEKANKIPTVVITIEDGHAEIRGASAPVCVVHADMDRDGETLTGDEIDAILVGNVYEGGPIEMETAIAEAREGLERYLPLDARPGL